MGVIALKVVSWLLNHSTICVIALKVVSWLLNHSTICYGHVLSWLSMAYEWIVRLTAGRTPAMFGVHRLARACWVSDSGTSFSRSGFKKTGIAVFRFLNPAVYTRPVDGEIQHSEAPLPKT